MNTEVLISRHREREKEGEGPLDYAVIINILCGDQPGSALIKPAGFKNLTIAKGQKTRISNIQCNKEKEKIYAH